MALLDLELEVARFQAEQLHTQALSFHVGPQQLHGIEILVFPHALASVVIWIGHLQWLRLHGYRIQGLVRCPDDAWRNVKPFRTVEEAHQNYMTSEEQQRLLNAIIGPDFKRLVYGALLTGCQYGELARMKVRDFDAASGTVLILEAKSGKPRRAFPPGRWILRRRCRR